MGGKEVEGLFSEYFLLEFGVVGPVEKSLLFKRAEADKLVTNSSAADLHAGAGVDGNTEGNVFEGEVSLVLGLVEP